MPRMLRCLFPLPSLLCAAFLVSAVQHGAPAAGAEIVREPNAAGTTLSTEELVAFFGRLTAAERAELLARLSDEQVRELLIQELDRATATGPTVPGSDTGMTATMISGVGTETGRIRASLESRLAAFRDLPSLPALVVAKLTEGRPPAHLITILLGLAVVLAVGAGAEGLFRRATSDLRRRLARPETDGLGARLGARALLLLLDLLALAIFAAAGLAVFFSFHQGHEPTRLAIVTYLAAVLAVRLTSAAARFLLAPADPELRLVPLDDDAARFLHRSAIGFFGVVAFGTLTSDLLLLLGLDRQLVLLLRMLLHLAAMILLVAIIWRARRAVGALMLGSAASTSRRRRILAEVWHIPVIAYVVGVYGVATLSSLAGHPIGTAAGLASLLLVVAVPLADAALRHALDRAFAGESEVEGHGGRKDYERVVRRAARILLLLAAVVLLGQLWRVDVFFVARETMGTIVTRAVLDIGLTVLVAYVGWELAKAAIDRRLAAAVPATGPGHDAEGGGGAGATRLTTLLLLLRRFLLVAIVVIAVMVVLSSLGVDIGPLLAGAGVVGLAIGFGAQTLVKDIISGVFFLLDDAFRFGEYIEVGAAKGTVERIHVRSLVLRHHLGPLNTVPFGEITQVTNFSRDWVIEKLEFRVTYDTDVNRVKRIFKDIGKELLRDPELGPGFLEPFKSQGVYAMEDSAMIVRGKFTTKPGMQFQIRKEVYRRVQEEFRKHGIRFAHRRVAVELPPGVDEESPRGQALADAAAAAVAAEQPGADGANQAHAGQRSS